VAGRADAVHLLIPYFDILQVLRLHDSRGGGMRMISKGAVVVDALPYANHCEIALIAADAGDFSLQGLGGKFRVAGWAGAVHANSFLTALKQNSCARRHMPPSRKSSPILISQAQNWQ
jgi:hypothetical protein